MNAIERKFFPGSKWLYLKIYCGVLTADNILNKVFDNVILPNKEHYGIKKSFFVRYHDPDFHLRIRMELIDPAESGEILFRVNQTLKEENKSRLITRIQVDTYDREIERYTEGMMDAAESFFSLDSQFVLNLIKESNCQHQKIALASYSFLDLMESFNLPLKEQLNIVRVIKDELTVVFNFTISSKKQISKKIKTILDVIQEIESSENILLLSHRDETSQWFKFHQFEISSTEKTLYDFFHMRSNRLFASNQRIYEFLCYHSVYRMLSKKIAIKS